MVITNSVRLKLSWNESYSQVPNDRRETEWWWTSVLTNFIYTFQLAIQRHQLLIPSPPPNYLYYLGPESKLFREELQLLQLNNFQNTFAKLFKSLRFFKCILALTVIRAKLLEKKVIRTFIFSNKSELSATYTCTTLQNDKCIPPNRYCYVTLH